MAEPCCAETANGPLCEWVRWQTNTRLLRFSMHAHPALSEVAEAACEELRQRSLGNSPHRTIPLPWCDCPGSPL